MKCKLSFSIVFVAILLNCAPSVVLNKLWKAEPQAGKSLAIVLPDNKMSVDYEGDVKNEFGKGDMISLIKANVKAILYHNLVRNTNFQDICFDTISSNSSKQVFPPAGDNEIESKYAPPVNSNLVLLSHQADYVLLFYRFDVKSHGGLSFMTLPENAPLVFEKAPGPSESTSSLAPLVSDWQPPFSEMSISVDQSSRYEEDFSITQYQMPIPNPVMTQQMQQMNTNYRTPMYSKDLAISTRFVLWDVKQQCPVAHGFTKNDVSGYFTDYNNWKDIVDKTVNEIMGETGMLSVKDTATYTLNHKSTVEVPGVRDKINLKTGRFSWLFANTITKNDIDSSDIKKMKSHLKSAQDMEVSSKQLFHFRDPRTPGTELDTVGVFAKSLSADLREDLSKQYPSVSFCPEQLRNAFQDQVLEHFSKFDYPVDTLDNAARDLAKADSIDYLIVYYGRFSQPKPKDEIKSLDDYDMNFYCNLIDVRTNTTLAGYYGDFGDLFNYTKGKSPDEAIKVFEILSAANLKSRVRL